MDSATSNDRQAATTGSMQSAKGHESPSWARFLRPTPTGWALVAGIVMAFTIVILQMQFSARTNDRLLPLAEQAGAIEQQLSFFHLVLREKASLPSSLATAKLLTELDKQHDHARTAVPALGTSGNFWDFLDRAQWGAQALALGENAEKNNGLILEGPTQRRAARALIDSINGLHLLVHQHLDEGSLTDKTGLLASELAGTLQRAVSRAAYLRWVLETEAEATNIVITRLDFGLLGLISILCLLALARVIASSSGQDAETGNDGGASMQKADGGSNVGNRTIIEATVEGYWEFDPEYALTIDVNGSLCRMLGYGRDEVVGKRVSDFATPESADAFERHFARRGDSLQQVFEITLKHRSGRDVFTRFYASTLRDRQGDIRGMFALVTDVSESIRSRREMEELSRALTQSNKNLSTFANRASQVLRTPLDRIGGFADLLVERYNDTLDDNARQYLEFIQSGAQKMNSTIDELLAQSVVSQPAQETGVLDLNRTLQAALDNFRDLKDWTQTEVSHDPLPTIPGDAPKLLELFRMLLEDAMNRRPTDARLHVHVKAEQENDNWILSFTDDGRIQSAEAIHATQAGLKDVGREQDRATPEARLAICRTIAEAHGGRLECSSDADRTVFSVILPAETRRDDDGELKGTQVKRAHILVVDDQPVNTGILKALLEKNYDVSIATNGAEALVLANKEPQPDLVLLDIMMPEMDGFEVCQRLKNSGWTRDIPVIFVSALDEKVDERRGLDLGAADYITKPISLPIVDARVATHLTVKRTKEALEEQSRSLADLVTSRTRSLEITQDVTILAMATLAETRDNETGHHIRRTQHYMQVLGLRLRDHPRFSHFLSDETIELLFKSAPLHDIGKVGIPDNILLKPGRLTEEEFEIMKKHTIYGYDAIIEAENMLIASNQSDTGESFLRFAREIAYGHHEKWDGSGYPNGLKGDEIPISARLMAVSDVYDALISSRVYKAAFLHERAVEIITDGRGTHFDPDIVDAFLEEETRFREIAATFADDTEEAA